jgi:hypothetical protein
MEYARECGCNALALAYPFAGIEQIGLYFRWVETKERRRTSR